MPGTSSFSAAQLFALSNKRYYQSTKGCRYLYELTLKPLGMDKTPCQHTVPATAFPLQGLKKGIPRNNKVSCRLAPYLRPGSKQALYTAENITPTGRYVCVKHLGFVVGLQISSDAGFLSSTVQPASDTYQSPPRRTQRRCWPAWERARARGASSSDHSCFYILYPIGA